MKRSNLTTDGTGRIIYAHGTNQNIRLYKRSRWPRVLAEVFALVAIGINTGGGWWSLNNGDGLSLAFFSCGLTLTFGGLYLGYLFRPRS